MKKNLLPTFILVAYCAILIKVMVFKDIPTIRAGGLMLNFAGTNTGHGPNFVPFKTIVPYLLGWKGWIIAGINLAGNIALLVPIGFLVPFIRRNMTWQTALAIGFASGLSIELMQTVLRVGIFDIDDVILNALGVVLGYWAFAILARWIRERSYRTITIAAMTTAAAAVAFYAGVVYPMTHQPLNVPPDAAVGQAEPGDNGRDLCGGTGGLGQIVSVANHMMTIQRNDGLVQALALTDRTTIKTSAGLAAESDLKTGDRVTVVVYDGKNATTVLRCR